MSWYDFARFAVSATFPLFHPMEVHGRENIPSEGPYILCSNHINLLDPIMLAWVTGVDIRFMAKVELFQKWPLSYIMKKLHSIPVDRGSNDMNAIRSSIATVKEGNVLGIFPEGHRFTDGTVHEFQTGVGLLVTRTKAPVLPIKITSDYKLFHKVHMYIGKPFTYENVPGLNGSEQLRACTQLIYDRVNEL